MGSTSLQTKFLDSWRTITLQWDVTHTSLTVSMESHFAFLCFSRAASRISREQSHSHTYDTVQYTGKPPPCCWFSSFIVWLWCFTFLVELLRKVGIFLNAQLSDCRVALKGLCRGSQSVLQHPGAPQHTHKDTMGCPWWPFLLDLLGSAIFDYMKSCVIQDGSA